MDGRYPESGEQRRTNGEAPWRLEGYGETVAPSARQMPALDGSLSRNPNANGGNGTPPWRAGWNEVAPPAQQAPVQQPYENPNRNGGNGAPPWRATPGVAPGFPTESPNTPGTGTPGTGGGGSWLDHVQRNGGGSGNGVEQPNVSGGRQGGVHVPDEQRRIIADSLNLKTSVLGFLWTGGLTGAGMHAGMYALDSKLLSTPLEQRSGLLKWWENYSPAHKALAGETEAARLAREAFQKANAAKVAAESGLKAVEMLPQTMTTAAEAALAKSPFKPEVFTKLQAQHTFLRETLPTLSGEEIAKQVGTRAQVARGEVLFDAATQLGKDVQIYAKGVGMPGSLPPADYFAKQIGTLETKLATMEGNRLAQIGIERQLEFLKSHGAANINELKAVIGTADEVAAGTKLFVAGSTEAKSLLDYATKSGAHAEATQALAKAQNNMAIKNASLETMMAKGPGAAHGNLLDTTVKGFARGLGISALTLGAGYGADYALGSMFGYGTPTSNGFGRFVMDGVITPAILLSGWQPRYKYPAAAATFLAARGMDYLAGTGASAETSMLLRPNTIDAVGVTASVLAPIPGKYKAFGVAATLAVGRGWNLLARATGLDGGSPAQLDSDTKSLVNRDQNTRTLSSFERAANKAKELGIENEAALELQLVDALNQTSLHKMDYNRQVAALSFGLGMSRLASGSRINPEKHGPGSRFLEGTNYDLGGDATMELRRAAGLLFAAEQYARDHRGETIRGQVMDEEYAKQLEGARKKVEEKLDLVYGEHKNLESNIYNPVKERCRTDLEGMMKYIVENQRKLATLSTSDKRYVAKFARDLALANMAYADYISGQNNGEEAKMFMQAAVGYMSMAEGLERDHADLREIKRIADRVRQRVPVAVQNQWNNNFNNPFQINR